MHLHEAPRSARVAFRSRVSAVPRFPLSNPEIRLVTDYTVSKVLKGVTVIPASHLPREASTIIASIHNPDPLPALNGYFPWSISFKRSLAEANKSLAPSRRKARGTYLKQKRRKNPIIRTSGLIFPRTNSAGLTLNRI